MTDKTNSEIESILFNPEVREQLDKIMVPVIKKLLRARVMMDRRSNDFFDGIMIGAGMHLVNGKCVNNPNSPNTLEDLQAVVKRLIDKDDTGAYIELDGLNVC